MTIKYYSREVYGQTLYYLADDRAAMQWNSITGKKTITQAAMHVVTNLTGATFERVFAPEV